jgi:hypothetical protein
MNTPAARLNAKYLNQLARVLVGDPDKAVITANDIKATLATLDPRIQAVVAGIVPGRLPPVISTRE